MSIITVSQKSETISETIYFESEKIIQLVDQAKNRATNGRIGDRALQKIVEMQDRSIKALIRKRRLTFPILEYEDLYAAAIEGIINQLKNYDPTRGKLASWLYFGIEKGLDRLCDDCTKDYQAKKEAEKVCPVAHLEPETDFVITERMLEYVERLKPEVRKVVSLVAQGWRYTEIAEVLSKNADAVRMCFNRAIAKLKAWMEPQVVQTEPKVTEEQAALMKQGWLRKLWSKVVRKFAQIRKQKCSSYSKENLMVRDRRIALPQARSKTPNPIQQAFSKGQALLKKVAQPIDDFYYRELNAKGRYIFLYGGSFVSTLLFSLLQANPLFAQAQQQGNSCLGWMCGPFQTMVNNSFWNDIDGGQEMLTAIFSAMQVFLVLIFVALVIWLFYNAVKERSVAWPFIALVLYIVLVVGSNFAGGLTVSNVNPNGIGFQ